MRETDSIGCSKCGRPLKEHTDDLKCLFEASSFGVSDEFRMAMARDINRAELSKEVLESAHGQVWDTQQVQEEFQIHAFLAPFVQVTRRSDGARGALTFQHLPRFYFAFQQE